LKIENKEKWCLFLPNPNGLLVLVLLLLNSSFPATVELLLLVLLLTVCPPDVAADLKLASDDLTGTFALPEAAVAAVVAVAPDNSAFKSEKLSEVRISERLDKLSKLIEPLII
jgi:hypothetical protein